MRDCVFHLCADLEPGDVARETVDLSILTQRNGGWRALIVSAGGMLVPEAERAAVRHTRMPLNRHGMMVNWRNRVHLETMLTRESPSLIHSHGIDALAHAAGLCRIHRLPLLADLTRPMEDTPRAKKLFRQLMDMTALVRVPSDFLAMQVREQFGFAPERIATIPPGIDMRWYDAGATSPERLQALSRAWRLPDRATVILAPMPLAEGSGHHVFFEALARLKRKDIYAVLVGDDRESPGMRASMEALVSHYRLDGQVVMPDHCLDWPAACWLASIVVAPNSTPRGQGIELLAAQSVGRPVIVTDCGANAEMALSGETAWVIPPDNAEALAAALQEAIDLPVRQRVDLAGRTRDFIADAFPQSAWFENIMHLYEALLHPARSAKSRAA